MVLFGSAARGKGGLGTTELVIGDMSKNADLGDKSRLNPMLTPNAPCTIGSWWPPDDGESIRMAMEVWGSTPLPQAAFVGYRTVQWLVQEHLRGGAGRCHKGLATLPTARPGRDPTERQKATCNFTSADIDSNLNVTA